MYEFLRGKLTEASPLTAILDVNGVGYKIFIPVSNFSKLPPFGTEVLIYTSFIIRDTGHSLYGFLTTHERNLFEVLLNISGIGPKTAIGLVGNLSQQDLHKAIRNGDIPLICKVPGVGKKTAERLIVEMKDKLLTVFKEEGLDEQPKDSAVHSSQSIQDALSALINLGYNQATAQQAIKKTLRDVPEKASLATLITTALRNI